jgi:hypothetical protein
MCTRSAHRARDHRQVLRARSGSGSTVWCMRTLPTQRKAGASRCLCTRGRRPRPSRHIDGETRTLQIGPPRQSAARRRGAPQDSRGHRVHHAWPDAVRRRLCADCPDVILAFGNEHESSKRRLRYAGIALMIVGTAATIAARVLLANDIGARGAGLSERPNDAHSLPHTYEAARALLPIGQASAIAGIAKPSQLRTAAASSDQKY